MDCEKKGRLEKRGMERHMDLDFLSSKFRFGGHQGIRRTEAHAGGRETYLFALSFRILR